MRVGKWSQRYKQVGAKPKRNQDRDRNREQPGRFTQSRDISVPGAYCCSSSESNGQTLAHSAKAPVHRLSSSWFHVVRGSQPKPQPVRTRQDCSLQVTVALPGHSQPTQFPWHLPIPKTNYKESRNWNSRARASTSMLPLPLFPVSKADGGGLYLGLAKAFQTLLTLLSTCLSHSANPCSSLTVAILCTQG